MPEDRHDDISTLRDRLGRVPHDALIDYLMDWVDEEPSMGDVLEDFITEYELEQIPDDVKHLRPAGG